jgi:SAM-dependent methyltransferase
MKEFNAKDYWETRLQKTYGLEGVGYKGLGEAYNKWMYKVRKRVFNKSIQKLDINLSTASVLDIGSGTGFYIDRWKEQQVKDLMGVDLTRIAVDKLSERFKEFQFLELDISDKIDVLQGKKFDIISAFDVLFHIVDEIKFEQAIVNIANLLKPGGTFILSDNFIHSPRIEATHHISRTLDDFTKVLKKNGFEIILRKPSFYFLNAPVDTTSNLLKGAWNIQNKIIYRGNFYGNLLGAFLYPLELVMLSFIKEGPSTEVMICHKK